MKTLVSLLIAIVSISSVFSAEETDDIENFPASLFTQRSLSFEGYDSRSLTDISNLRVKRHRTENADTPHDPETASPYSRKSMSRASSIRREGSVGQKRTRCNSDPQDISPCSRGKSQPAAVIESLTPERPTFTFSDAQKAELRQAGVPDFKIYIIELLQSAFLRSPHGTPLKPSSYFKEQELDAILKKTSSDYFTSQIFALKSLYGEKIPLANAPSDVVFTPAVRISADSTCLGPNFGQKGLTTMVESCASMKLEHVNAHTFVEEETPETSEERAARHALQEKLFQALETQRGISDVQRASALDATTSAWSSYFDYMRLRRDSIEQTSQPKIKSTEIEEMFTKFVSSSYESLTIKNCSVFFRQTEVDLTRTNVRGQSNLELLSCGLAPIGADGKSMNLHHLTRRHPGVLVLVPESFHREHSDLLHFRKAQHMLQPLQPVDRVVFNEWKDIALKVLGKHLQTQTPHQVAVKLNFDEIV